MSDDEVGGYMVLASNAYHKVEAYGTAETGTPFRSEEQAEKARKRMERAHPTLDWLVLPIKASAQAQGVLDEVE